MTELLITIPPKKEALVRELIKQLGGSVENKKSAKPNTIKRDKQKIDHTYLFGKWKEHDIDAGKIRAELWKRNER